VDSRSDGNSLTISGGRGFYYIYDHGDRMENASLNGCRAANYSSSVEGKEKAYSYKKLDELNVSYHSDYGSLKSRLKVPGERNFAIIVFDESRNILFDMSREIPRTEVVASEYPIEILRDNEMMKGALRILEW